MGKRISLKKHRFILKQYAQTTPSKRKAIVEGAPSVFFTVIREIGKRALKLGFRKSVSKKLVDSSSIKAAMIKNNKLVAEIIRKVLRNESLYSSSHA